MKNRPIEVRPSQHIFRCGCIIAIVLALSGSIAKAIVVDFDEFPDGTPASEGNPYAGVLDLDATGQTITADGTVVVKGTITTQFDPSHGGVVQALAPDVSGGGDFASDVTGTFLEPVTDGSLQVFVYRDAGYSYVGSNDVGDVFNGSGIITGLIESGGTLTWQQLAFSLPAGYHLTSFDIHNHDPVALDGAVWIDNVAFTVVPEPSTAALIGLSLLLFIFRLSRASAGKPRALCRFND